MHKDFGEQSHLKSSWITKNTHVLVRQRDQLSKEMKNKQIDSLFQIPKYCFYFEQNRYIF